MAKLDPIGADSDELVVAFRVMRGLEAWAVGQPRCSRSSMHVSSGATRRTPVTPPRQLRSAILPNKCFNSSRTKIAVMLQLHDMLSRQFVLLTDKLIAEAAGIRFAEGKANVASCS